MSQDFVTSTWPLGPPRRLLCLLTEEVEADLPAKFWLVSLAGDKHGTVVPVPVRHQSGRACAHAPHQGLQITLFAGLPPLSPCKQQNGRGWRREVGVAALRQGAVG